MLRLTVAIAALLLGSAPLTTTPAAAQDQLPSNASWMKGDGLRPDPQLRIGALPNGMRYVIRKNATPPGEASVRLRIDTGSLNEDEDQRGLAHFLEHMVLNGTENVPEGEFVKRLERQGLRFGPDTNASTDFNQTVFKLELPKAEPTGLGEAVTLLREIASRATLDAKSIDQERGIILSEERVRANVGLRQITDELAWLFPGQRLPTRMPIGTVEVIKNAPRQRLLDFYRAWYRPERATLVIVGDVDMARTEALIAQQFNDWRGQGPAGTEPDGGTLRTRSADASIFSDPAIATMVRLTWVRPEDRQPDSIAKRSREFEEQLAIAILNRRLSKLAQADNAPPYVSASVSVAEFEKTGEVSTISSVARNGNWRQALGTLDAEQRRLVQFGVTADELEREMTGARAALEASVAAATTRSNASLAEAIVGALAKKTVVTSPADRLAFFEVLAKDLTAAKVNAAARRLFSGSGPLVYLTANKPPAEGKAAVLAQLRAAQQLAVSAPLAQPPVPWPYQQFGTPGKVVEQRSLAEVGATAVRFANGVRLIVRPSSQLKEQVLIQVRFGDGRLLMDPTKRSPEWALGTALAFGGTNKLDADAINRSLTGKVVGAGFDVDDEDFVLGGATRPADLPTQMQLLAAFMTDAGWRSTGWNRTRASAGMIHDRYENTPGGVLQRDSGVLLRSGDKRWELPSRAAMRASTIEEAKSLLQPQLKDGPVEIVIAGDISVQQAIAQTAATFGALPQRSTTRLAVGEMRFPAPTAEPITLFHKGREDQAVALIAWPTTGFTPETRKLSRALTLLGTVFQLRLTDRFREGDGISYSPGAGHAASQTWGNYGYLAAQIEAPPEKLDAFYREAQQIAADLAAKPVSEDELDRARKPLLAAIERARNGNQFWVSALAKADQDPFKLETILTQEADYRATTAADLQAAANRFLLASTAYRIRVVKGPVPGTPPAPTVVAAPASPLEKD